MIGQGPGDWDDDGQAAEYVLGVLPEVERVIFARRLATDPALQQSVRFWNEKLAVLTKEVAPVAPPPHLLQAIQSRIYGAQTTAPRSWWNNLLVWRAVSVASLAALAMTALLYAMQFRSSVSTPSEILVSEVAGENDLVNFATVYDAGTSELRFNRIAGAKPPGRDFELWIIVGTNPPLSLGVLPDQPSGRIAIAENLRATLVGSTLAITDEPAGGSPSGQPTGNIVASGKINAI